MVFKNTWFWSDRRLRSVFILQIFHLHATLNRRRHGYNHLVVVHKYEFVNLDTGAHTQTIEGLWKHLKDSYRDIGGAKSEDLEVFIAQWCFRRNFCRDNNMKYERVASAIAKYWKVVDEIFEG